jgi:6-phosphogluconolactonase
MSGFCFMKINNLMFGLCSWALRLYVKIFLFVWLVTTTTSSIATTIIYVANADSQDISVFHLDEKSGLTTLLQTLDVGGMVMPMALARNKNQSHKKPLKKNRLYAAIRSQPYRVVVLAIDNTTGHLTLDGSAPLVDNMANISLDSDGRYFFAASYAGNKISINALDENGIPLSSAQVLTVGAHPHQITADPADQFVYVSLLGEDRLDYFRFDTATAKPPSDIAPVAILPPGSGPRHFVFSPQGHFLYLLDELGANLHVFKRDTKSGKTVMLESHGLLPKNSAITPWAADIHMTSNGKFLYVTERTTNSLSGFNVNEKTGKLKLIGSWDTEGQPRAFAISPSGRYLAVVGQKSHQMTVYAINAATGELLTVNRTATGANPGWVEIISLPNQITGN